MRKGIVVNVKAVDRRRLAAIVANRNSPQKHFWRARIVLLTADGLGTATIMRQTGKSKSVVWRWQERFIQAGVDGLLRDKTRPGNVRSFVQEISVKVDFRFRSSRLSHQRQRRRSLGTRLRRQVPRLQRAATRPWGLTAQCGQANSLTMPLMAQSR
jgi:hypothetical protein